MGHRALVAYEHDDGTYDLHASHWGAADLAVARRVTPTNPLGGTDSGDALVDPEPVATGLALADAIRTHLDPLTHEALFVVAADWSVTAYRTVWFGLTGDGADPVARSAPVGAAVEVRTGGADACDDARVTGWYRGAKTALARLVDGGRVPPSAVPTALAATTVELAVDRDVRFHGLDPPDGGDCGLDPPGDGG